MKTQNIESRCYRTGKYTVCMRVSASFSQEILQAGAVKGLITLVETCFIIPSTRTVLFKRGTS